MNTINQRALIILGAGASVEYGIPITSAFTNDITDKINNNRPLAKVKTASI